MRPPFVILFCFFPLLIIIGTEPSVQGQPSVLDYTSREAWYALPDSADLQQTDLPADVFFIHPGTYFRNEPVNQVNINPSEYRRLDFVFWNQTSLFRDIGRIFFPHYAQMNLQTFRKGDSIAFGLAAQRAYSDIHRAFTWYLNNHNKGRPVIIASHSQGSYMALRLLSDFMDSEYHHLLVVAYVVGIPLSEEHFQEFDSICLCRTPDATGCIVGWKSIDGKTGRSVAPDWSLSFVDKVHRSTTELQLTCVNPLSWTTETNLFSGRPQQILYPITNENSRRFSDRSIRTKCDNGFVRVFGHERGIFNGPLGDLHLYDYNLFYGEIRENCKARLENWFIHSGD